MVDGPAASLNFSDTASVSGYAKEPVTWMVGKGLINGIDGRLMPTGKATRAQVATLFMRYSEL
ncbi:MAG: S-layer homology domain-containing protein [Clostridia bacterium]|nr:S-layer homology domain-containing protein [Clostridia bacterium]